MAKSARERAKDYERELEDDVRARQPALLKLGAAIAIFLLGAVITAVALMSIKTERNLPGGWSTGGGGGGSTDASFVPPTLAQLEDGPEADAIRRGMQIFNMTYAAEELKQFVGNGLACTNCHIDTGRKAGSAPMWGAWPMFPQYRKKTDAISTMADRIEGCFNHSMNAQASPAGKAPPQGSDVYKDLEIYFAWVSKGAAQYTALEGRGYPDLAKPADGYDPARGKIVYNNVCAACHGPDGAGAQNPNDGSVVYPALWGAHSYNWGAGMAVISTAASFIKANMPFDKPGSLTEQQAWDVAAFMNSRPRPKDVRQTGTVAENAKKNFQGFATYYGTEMDGRLLGTGVPGKPFAKVPTVKKDGSLADPAVAAMAPASPGS